jgi:hypothetical protein
MREGFVKMGGRWIASLPLAMTEEDAMGAVGRHCEKRSDEAVAMTKKGAVGGALHHPSRSESASLRHCAERSDEASQQAYKKALSKRGPLDCFAAARNDGVRKTGLPCRHGEKRNDEAIAMTKEGEKTAGAMNLPLPSPPDRAALRKTAGLPLGPVHRALRLEGKHFLEQGNGLLKPLVRG